MGTSIRHEPLLSRGRKDRQMAKCETNFAELLVLLQGDVALGLQCGNGVTHLLRARGLSGASANLDLIARTAKEEPRPGFLPPFC